MDPSRTSMHPSRPDDFDTDVLIVGAGPSGLTLAAALAARGMRTAVIDRLAEGANTSRAAVVHARTLEVLEPLGVSRAPRGARPAGAALHDPRSRPGADADRLRRAADALSLHADGVAGGHRERAAAALRRTGRAGAAPARAGRPERRTTPAPPRRSTTAAGCARATSSAPTACTARCASAPASRFAGGSYGESFVLADVRLSGGVPRDEVILYFSPAGMVVVAPLPDGVHRIVATVDDAPEQPGAAYVQALLDARGPRARACASCSEVLWGSRFRVHHRVADVYRAGRVLLAGDAAHVHSPAGGQGMNVGILDAVSLAGALEQGARRRHAALDAYGAERRPVAAAGAWRWPTG